MERQHNKKIQKSLLTLWLFELCAAFSDCVMVCFAAVFCAHWVDVEAYDWLKPGLQSSNIISPSKGLQQSTLCTKALDKTWKSATKLVKYSVSTKTQKIQ